jgi:hypothetical protein
MLGWLAKILASSRLWVRCVAAVGVVLLSLAWTGLLAAIADIPSGYGAAQSRDQIWLEEHSTDWSIFKLGTSRDLSRYIPGYLIFGVLLIVVIVAARRPEAAIAARGDRVPALIALGTLLVGAVADVVETLLFRRSLTRLLATGGSTDISNLTSLTATMTVIKWVGLAASYVTLIVLIVLPRRT